MQNSDRPDTPALVIDNVYKTYTQWQRSGKIRDIVKNLLRPQTTVVKALDNVSLRVNRGDFLAYAGANGAGKSTTIKILAGILHPTDGKVTVLGMDPGKQRVQLMKRIGVLFGQRTELWWDHPVITSYEWKKHVWNIDSKQYNEKLEAVTDLLGLSDFLFTFARELSFGQRMRADLGMLLLHNPEIIFLDEPTLGLDVLAKKQMIRFLKNINKNDHVTIVVTSHDMDDLEEMAERIVLISKGKIIYDGDFDRLRLTMGASSRIRITTRFSPPPKLEGMSLVKSQDNINEYAFCSEEVDLRRLFQALSERDDILDIDMRKAPIEDVVSRIYLEELSKRSELYSGE